MKQNTPQIKSKRYWLTSLLASLVIIETATLVLGLWGSGFNTLVYGIPLFIIIVIQWYVLAKGVKINCK